MKRLLAARNSSTNRSDAVRWFGSVTLFSVCPSLGSSKRLWLRAFQGGAAVLTGPSISASRNHLLWHLITVAASSP